MSEQFRIRLAIVLSAVTFALLGLPVQHQSRLHAEWWMLPLPFGHELDIQHVTNSQGWSVFLQHPVDPSSPRMPHGAAAP